MFTGEKWLPTWLQMAREAGDSDARASAVVQVYKSCRLGALEHADLAQEVAGWARSSNAYIRQEVVFGLCGFHGLRQFSWLLPDAWEKASSLDMHWYVSAIEGACQRAADVPAELVFAVARTLLAPAPDCPDDLIKLEWAEAWSEYREVQENSRRAMRHLVKVVLPGRPWSPEADIDWECVTRLLYWAATSGP